MFIFQCRLSQLAACLCRQNCSKNFIIVLWNCWINTMTIQSYKRVFVSLELWCQHHLGTGDTWNLLLFGSRYSSFMMSPTIKLYRPNSQLFGTDSSAATATCEWLLHFRSDLTQHFPCQGLTSLKNWNVCVTCCLQSKYINTLQAQVELDRFAFCSEHFR